MTKAECIARLREAIKTYAEKLFENENRETPVTTSVNFITQLYQAPPTPANLSVINVNLIGTIGASIAIALRDAAEAKKIKYSEAVSAFLDKFEFSTDVLDAFTDNLFSLSTIIGREMPGDLQGWRPIVISVAVIVASMITAILTTKALNTLDEKEPDELYAASRTQKIAMTLASAYEGFNNISGTISAVEIAFAFTTTLVTQRADNIVNYAQIIGGGIYAAFKGVVTTAQLVERLAPYQLSDEKRERLDKAVERISNIGYIGYKGALYYTLYQSGYLPYIVAAITAKVATAAINTKVSFWSKPTDGEQMRLLSADSVNESSQDRVVNREDRDLEANIEAHMIPQRSRCTII